MDEMVEYVVLKINLGGDTSWRWEEFGLSVGDKIIKLYNVGNGAVIRANEKMLGIDFITCLSIKVEKV